MEIKVIFEDKEILIIDKPSGLIVNRASTVKKEKTLQDWIEEYLEWKNYCQKLKPAHKKHPKYQDFCQRSGIVHRLDKGTSGLLVIAKTPQSFFNLQSQFKERKVKKRYQALVYGKVEIKEGEVRLPVGRTSWDREKFGVVVDGREAITFYKRLKVYQKNNHFFTLLEIQPKTGRTHQIRVHFQALGYPLVGDSKYANQDQLSFSSWCPRLFLHSYFLGFSHPRTRKWQEFRIPLPSDLQNVLTYLSS
jgi:23S rRNA pseudouridine1911/1915/1917 synthase